MPGGIVEENCRILLPARSLPIQLATEMPEEHGHHVGVCIYLSQGAPYLTIGVESNDQ